MKKGELAFDNAAIRDIIRYYTRESVGGQNVGRLRVALRQPGSELKLTQVVDFLKQRGVRVERT